MLGRCFALTARRSVKHVVPSLIWTTSPPSTESFEEFDDDREECCPEEIEMEAPDDPGEDNFDEKGRALFDIEGCDAPGLGGVVFGGMVGTEPAQKEGQAL